MTHQHTEARNNFP